MKNLCAVVNAVMNILSSATVLPSSISGSENPTGKTLFLFDLLRKLSFYVACESNRTFFAIRFGSGRFGSVCFSSVRFGLFRFGSVRFVVISSDLKASCGDNITFSFGVKIHFVAER